VLNKLCPAFDGALTVSPRAVFANDNFISRVRSLLLVAGRWRRAILPLLQRRRQGRGRRPSNSQMATLTLKRSAAAIVAALALASPSSAHAQWANGEPVPAGCARSAAGPTTFIICELSRCNFAATAIISTATQTQFLRAGPSPRRTGNIGRSSESTRRTRERPTATSIAFSPRSKGPDMPRRLHLWRRSTSARPGLGRLKATEGASPSGHLVERLPSFLAAGERDRHARWGAAVGEHRIAISGGSAYSHSRFRRPTGVNVGSLKG
jgi:hypothetical protein